VRPREVLARIAALVVDYDRTLTDETLAPHPAAMRALRHARERGRRVVVVSGRNLSFLRGVLGDVPDAIVAENGCVLAMRGAAPERLARPDARTRAALERLAIGLERGDVLYATDAIHEGRVRDALHDAGARADVIRNRDRIMIVPRGVDKATGALLALARLGVEPALAAAAGDAENDLALLRSAGYAIAVGNALPSVRAAADRVTSGYGGEGLARWIEDEWLCAEVVA